MRREVKARGIDWPVAVDGRYEIWRAFSNQYWPALYFVDREGVIRDHRFGEGRYEQSERVIQELLGLAPQDAVTVVGEGDEAEADWARLNSPETYLGYERTGNLASPLRPPELYQWALSGDWTVERDQVGLTPPAGGSCSASRHATSTSCSDERASRTGSVPRSARRRGSRAAHGVDADADGNGHLDEDRLYQLVRRPGAVEERTFEITFHGDGVEAYVFTFGSRGAAMTPIISRGFRGRRDDAPSDRVPPGQNVTKDYPVLSAGPTPHTPLEQWDFSIVGDVDEPRRWTWEEFRALPSEEVTVDIHCVTKWSKLDTVWRGVSVDTLLDGLETAAGYVVQFCDGGYTTNLPLADATGGKAGSPSVTTASRSSRSMVDRRGIWSLTSTSGRARSGCEGCDSPPRTSPASGRSTATTTTAIHGASSGTGATDLAGRGGPRRCSRDV